MKVNIKDISYEGIELAGDIDSALIGSRDEDNFHFTTPLHIKSHIEKHEDGVVSKSEVHSKFSAVCYRCLEEVECEWNKEFVIDFPVEKKQEFIDMTEEIRQEVILNFPSRIKCKEDCQGLCMDCGTNLNKADCKCHHTVELADGASGEQNI